MIVVPEIHVHFAMLYYLHILACILFNVPNTQFSKM